MRQADVLLALALAQLTILAAIFLAIIFILR